MGLPRPHILLVKNKAPTDMTRAYMAGYLFHDNNVRDYHVRAWLSLTGLPRTCPWDASILNEEHRNKMSCTLLRTCLAISLFPLPKVVGEGQRRRRLWFCISLLLSDTTQRCSHGPLRQNRVVLFASLLISWRRVWSLIDFHERLRSSWVK